MIGQNTIACVIPARLNSTRFPQKVLKNLQGKPILQWIYEKAYKLDVFDEIIFLVDDKKTAELVDSFNGKWAMTSADCPSGTFRLIEYRNKSKKKFDFWLNWQADEPLLPKELILDLFNGIDSKNEIFTLKKMITKEDALKAHIVKVVTNSQNEAMYFSRAMIPFKRDIDETAIEYFKHIGLYLYCDQALQKISQFEPSDLEKTEKLEQLTFMYNGLKIKVLETRHEGIGIDFEEDLALAESFLNTKPQVFDLIF